MGHVKRAVLVASITLVALGAYGVRELRRVPPHVQDPTSPLTDVAGKPFELDVHADEAKRQLALALIAANRRVPELPPPRVVMPEQMPDPANPPQWTAPRAGPPPPEPPDPFVPPPVAVDPTPGHHTNAE